MASHQPLVFEPGVIHCACGHRQEGIYVTDFGARVGYFQHVVFQVAQEQHWPDEFWVDGDMASD